MNIVFAHSPKIIEENGSFKQYQVMILPLGIWSLAEIAKSAGHNVEIVHLGIEKLVDDNFNLGNYMRSGSPDIVCFSLHWHLQLHEVYRESVDLKNKCPEVKILLGGITASVFYSEIMKSWEHIDFVIRGEAEKSLEMMLGSNMRDYSSVPNLSWRRDGKVIHNPISYVASVSDLDSYKHTGLSLMKNARYYRGRYFYDRSESFDRWSAAPRVWYLYVGRGCSVNCAYCGGGKLAHNTFATRDNISFRPHESVVMDMEIMRREYDTSSFYICYHPSQMSKDYYSELFNRAGANSDFSMIFEYYNSLPDKKFVENFGRTFNKERSQLVFSPTAFTEEARKRFCPSAFSDDVIEEFVKNCEDKGLQSVLFYSPLPQEDESEMMRGAERAAEMLRKYKGLAVIIMPIEIEPLSPWSLSPEKYGIKAIRNSFDEYIAHHARRRGVFTEEDLGYEFPAFERIMTRLKEKSESPRWICFQPYLYDSHGS